MGKGIRAEPPAEAVVQIDRLAAGGDGVGRLPDGRAVFVPRAAPGDRLRVALVAARPGYARARIVELLAAGPSRTEPPCPVYAACGGCQWQHLEYTAQLTWKTRLVTDALERVGGLRGVPVHPCLPCDRPWGYRHKVAVPFGRRDGRTVSGFYAPGSHEIVEFPSCGVQHPALDALVAEVRRLAESAGVPGYDETTGGGLLRHLVARVSRARGEVLAVLVTARQAPLPWAARLADDLPFVVGVLQNVNPGRGNAVLGAETRLLAGRDHLEEELDGLRFLISAHSFFQISPDQAARLYRVATRYADPGPADTAVDLYAGVGALSLYLARSCGAVDAVEEVSAAARDAAANAAANGLDNVRSHAGRVEQVLPRLRPGPDVTVLDPPRRGCTPEAIEALAASAPRRIVYVSCNPSTLARDLHSLTQAGYGAVEAQPVDLFPQTAHVECVVRLERRRA